MAKEYKNSLKELSNKLKSEPIKTPIQEVRPVEEKPKDPKPAKSEYHLNIWMPDSLGNRLKIHAVNSKKSIKQLTIEALEQYLNSNAD
ncbi:hypothetical protein GCM10027592_63260 [Spirosoma flavus]